MAIARHITHETMEPSSLSKRHVHERSEQTWIVESGEGILLLADERTEPLRAGAIIRTPAGDVHGVENTGSKPLVYLAVTTPPQDFSYAYDCRLPDETESLNQSQSGICDIMSW